MRGYARPPRPGRKQLYIDRMEWRWYQKYLPEELRLGEDNLPEEEWFDFRGIDVHVDRYPVANRRGLVVLLHGGGGNGRVLSPFAGMLAGMGVEVIAPDMPGYGLTVRTRRLKPSYALWTEVAHQIIESERSRDGVPVILFGLSIGGLLAYMAAARNGSVSGLIATTLADTRKLATMAVVGRNAVVGAAGFIMMKAIGPLLDRVQLPMRLLAPMRLISNDPEVSRVFMRDRLAGGSRVQVGFLRSLMNVRPALEPEEFNVCPVLLAHPAIDPWTPLELSQRFFDRIRAPKELVVLRGCGHFPMEDPGRGELKAALQRFLDSVLGAASETG